MTLLRRGGKMGAVHYAICSLLLGMAGAGQAAPPLAAGATTLACKGAENCLGADDYFSRVAYQPGASALAGEDRLSIGLALAGGGTRAAQFSIGVLKGLFESGLLADVDYLSTVSGGGYAGYWYMSQRIHGAEPADMFRDCIPDRYAGTARRMLGRDLATCTPADGAGQASCLCPETPTGRADDGTPRRSFTSVLADAENRHFSDPFRYQNSLRGHTDLFVPSFSYADTRSDRRLLPSVAPAVAMQLLTAATFDLVGDTLFDWNLNASPSRAMYRDGIRRIYGLPPLDCAAHLAARVGTMAPPAFSTCVIDRPLADELDSAALPQPITFADLRASRQGDRRLPYWIINATTPVLNCPKADGREGCVVREVFGHAAYPPHKATFEFTADYWGAGEFGYWRTDDGLQPFGTGILSADEAVASSAAFFDPNERSFMLGGLVNGLLQITGFRWGNYIHNPHVSVGLRREHRMIPLLYVFHHWVENKEAVDIHLIDGGQSENLGAYSLIRRRVPNIIISDHAGEADSGNMEDICRLRASLALPEFAQWNGGRIWHIHFDDLAELDKVCTATVDPAELPPTAPQVEQRYRYNVHAWKQPVLRGCAVELPGAAGDKPDESLSCAELKLLAQAGPGAGENRRHLNLFLIKPALDLAGHVDGQTPANPAPGSAHLESVVEIDGFLRANANVRDALGVLLFPNHSTINLTLDSSPWLFGAYRELAARAARHLQVRNGALVVAGNEGLPPLRPKLSYLVNREARELSEKLGERLGESSGESSGEKRLDAPAGEMGR